MTPEVAENAEADQQAPALHVARPLTGNRPSMRRPGGSPRKAGTISAAAVRAGMEPPVRAEALGKAARYFEAARELYPQDIYAAVGHAAVLSSLGRNGEALGRIAEARRWAPSYGNLMLAEAEIHLRTGNLAAAEQAYRAAETAAALRAPHAARAGLTLVGVRRSHGGPPETQEALAGQSPARGPRRLPEAKVEELSVGGDAGGVEPASRRDP